MTHSHRLGNITIIYKRLPRLSQVVHSHRQCLRGEETTRDSRIGDCVPQQAQQVDLVGGVWVYVCSGSIRVEWVGEEEEGVALDCGGLIQIEGTIGPGQNA